ncbi:hypothetical protein CRUP_006368 [Coryphaenoides rupestris]|nr:hypothetical protein CRUP_006368 [Coryphaenoides rupestris]
MRRRREKEEEEEGGGVKYCGGVDAHQALVGFLGVAYLLGNAVLVPQLLDLAWYYCVAETFTERTEELSVLHVVAGVDPESLLPPLLLRLHRLKPHPLSYLLPLAPDPPLPRLPGSGGLRVRFLDSTVDLWTKAASTMARPSAFTSSSSWHRMQETRGSEVKVERSQPLTLCSMDSVQCPPLGSVVHCSTAEMTDSSTPDHLCGIVPLASVGRELSSASCSVGSVVPEVGVWWARGFAGPRDPQRQGGHCILCQEEEEVKARRHGAWGRSRQGGSEVKVERSQPLTLCSMDSVQCPPLGFGGPLQHGGDDGQQHPGDGQVYGHPLLGHLVADGVHHVTRQTQADWLLAVREAAVTLAQRRQTLLVSDEALHTSELEGLQGGVAFKLEASLQVAVSQGYPPRASTQDHHQDCSSRSSSSSSSSISSTPGCVRAVLTSEGTVHTYEQVIYTLQKAVNCTQKEAVSFATTVDRERCPWYRIHQRHALQNMSTAYFQDDGGRSRVLYSCLKGGSRSPVSQVNMSTAYFRMTEKMFRARARAGSSPNRYHSRGTRSSRGASRSSLLGLRLGPRQ